MSSDVSGLSEVDQSVESPCESMLMPKGDAVRKDACTEVMLEGLQRYVESYVVCAMHFACPVVFQRRGSRRSIDEDRFLLLT